MKKGFGFIFIGFIFCYLSFLSYKDNEATKTMILGLTNEIKIITGVSNKIKENNMLYVSINDRIDEVTVSLKREDYNTVLEDINNVSDEQAKEKLLNRMPSLLDAITKEEERVRKYTSIENLNGKVTAYTAFCSDGCHGYTASGRYVGDSIYYYDKDYGKVMIVAADRSYPFGTIVRFNNLSYFGHEVFAIVLDRGGAIGKNKRALFDLLLETEKSANDFGVAKAVSCDILRLGY